MRTARSALSHGDRESAGAAVATWRPSSHPVTISAYLAIGDELDPAPLIEALHQLGHTMCLPVMTGRDQPLTFRAYVPGDALATLQWGIREPTADKTVLDPDLLLVPLLAVDRAGYRLGYGGGYYDRTLKRLRALKRVFAIGLAFDAQVIDAVPHLDYDEPIDALLTPSGYRTFPL